MPEFIESENWPPNSPNLNPADYSAWGALQQMVYCHKISDTDQLQQVLIDSLAQVSQDTTHSAVSAYGAVKPCPLLELEARTH